MLKSPTEADDNRIYDDSEGLPRVRVMWLPLVVIRVKSQSMRALPLSLGLPVFLHCRMRDRHISTEVAVDNR